MPSVSKFSVSLFFLSWFFFGISLVDHFGISWDEDIQRQHGIVSYHYVKSIIFNDEEDTGNNSQGGTLNEYEHRYYGVVFSLPMYLLERLLGLDDYRDIHLLRHYGVFFLFWLSSVVLYELLNRQFRHRGWALLGAIFLILSPRLFAHAFFNVKDIVFFSLYLFSLASLLKFIDQLSLKSLALHSLMSAMAIGARIAGVIVPVLSVFWLILFAVRGTDKESRLRIMFRLVPGYLLLTTAFMILLWPTLWGNPFNRFIEAFRIMGNYPFDASILLLGKYYSAAGAPWFYIPAWFSVTVPVVFLLLFVYVLLTDGFLLFLSSLQCRFAWLNNRENRLVAICLSFFMLPVFAVILKNSTLYNGWRQLFFIYGPFIVISAIGARKIDYELKKRFPTRIGANVFKAALFVSLCWISVRMYIIHPHQQVYFNVFAGSDRFYSYDLDYWGVSYLQGLKYVYELEREKDSCVKILFETPPGEMNVHFLPAEMRNTFCTEGVTTNNYDYFLANFRNKQNRDHFNAGTGLFADRAAVIAVDREPILGIFKSKP